MAKKPQQVVRKSLLGTIMETNAKHFGDRKTFTATELERKFYGIEPYGLALQYLIDCHVVPLQSMIQLAGPPKTYKTSALLEFSRMFLPRTPDMPVTAPDVDGLAYFLFTEGRMSASKIKAILRGQSESLQLSHQVSVDTWQVDATNMLLTHQSLIEKVRTANRSKGKQLPDYYGGVVPPLFIGLDSLTGAQSQEVINALNKDGTVGRMFPERAMRNTNWFGTWSSQMLGIPAIFMWSNHEKDPISDGGGLSFEKRTPGGISSQYYCSLDIRVSKIKELKSTYAGGAELKWRVHFSGIGDDKRSIVLRFIETHDEQGRDLHYYDWDTAIVTLLKSLQEESMYKERLEPYKVSEHSNGYWSCPGAGVDYDRAKEEKISAADLGRIIQGDVQTRRAIREALRIKERQVWTPGVELGDDNIFGTTQEPEGEAA